MNRVIYILITIIIIVVLLILIRGSMRWQYLEMPKEERLPVDWQTYLDWQIYQRPNTIFSFRYPAEWTVDDLKNRFYVYLNNEQGENIVTILSENLAFTLPTSTPFCITHPENNRCEILKTDKYSASIDWNPESYEGAIAKIVIPEEYTPEKWVLIITLSKVDPYTKNIFRQILTSFQFIKPTIDTSNWQTYWSKKYGFQVKYPQEWRYSDGLGGIIQLFPNPEIIPQKIQEIRDIPSFTINVYDIPIGDRGLDLRELFNKIYYLN